MSTYTLYVHPRALREIKNLPGHVRQRASRVIGALSEQARPPGSVELSALVLPKSGITLHRLRIEKWRVIYAIDEEEKIIDVLAIRQRPPYDYGDLSQLLSEIV